MTIRNSKLFMDSLWDWGILDGCFGDTRIKPTDLDGLVERNGNILILEGKSPGKPITKGQEIVFNQFLLINKIVGYRVFTIIVIWGTPNEPERIQQWGYTPCDAGLEELRRVVSSWFNWASKNRLKLKPDRNNYVVPSHTRHIQ